MSLNLTNQTRHESIDQVRNFSSRVPIKILVPRQDLIQRFPIQLVQILRSLEHSAFQLMLSISARTDFFRQQSMLHLPKHSRRTKFFSTSTNSNLAKDFFHHLLNRRFESDYHYQVRNEFFSAVPSRFSRLCCRISKASRFSKFVYR